MQNDEYFRKLLFDSPFAWWQWDIPSNRVTFNDLKVTMLGYNQTDFIDAGYQKFTELLHPDDYEKAMNAMFSVLRKETELYQIDYRILSKSSGYHWYMDRGTVIEYSISGSPSKLRGIVIDLGKEAKTGSSIDTIIQLLDNSAQAGSRYMFTICSNCGNAKIDTYRWIPVTEDLRLNLSNGITHGICPECIKKLYPEMAEKILAKIFLKRDGG